MIELRELAPDVSPLVISGILRELTKSLSRITAYGVDSKLDQGPFAYDLTYPDLQVRELNARWNNWTSAKYACQRCIKATHLIIKNLQVMNPDLVEVFELIGDGDVEVTNPANEAVEQALLLATHMYDTYAAYEANPTKSTRAAWKDATVAFETFRRLKHVDD